MSKWTENKINKAIGYRTPKLITSHYTYKDCIYGTLIFELCPTCSSALDKAYQEYCSGCGQRLKWPSAATGTKPIISNDLMKQDELSETVVSEINPSSVCHIELPEQTTSLAVAETKVGSDV